MRNVRTISVLFGAAGAVLLAGCGSDAPSGSSSSSSAAPSTTATSGTAAASSEPASSSASSAAPSSLQAGLLTASELGTGFTEQPQTKDDQPLPCTPDAKPIFEQFKPSDKVERDFANSGSTLLVDEAIAQYDVATAKQVFAAAVKGFSCSSATLGGQPVTITKRPGATSDTEIQTAAWDLAVGDQPVTAAVTRIGDKFAAVSFTATKASAEDINVEKVLQTAGTKIAALP